mmetsp:Transcript_178/g.606  ORF Transcript_178/g.606 Transcript_178/m.606 type:complete len:236 (+) Transcript_178:666-1373(+)
MQQRHLGLLAGLLRVDAGAHEEGEGHVVLAGPALLLALCSECRAEHCACNADVQLYFAAVSAEEGGELRQAGDEAAVGQLQCNGLLRVPARWRHVHGEEVVEHESVAELRQHLVTPRLRLRGLQLVPPRGPALLQAREERAAHLTRLAHRAVPAGHLLVRKVRLELLQPHSRRQRRLAAGGRPLSGRPPLALVSKVLPVRGGAEEQRRDNAQHAQDIEGARINGAEALWQEPGER